MDLTPFLGINLLDPKENTCNELKKFCKSQFDVDNIFSTASELKYSNLIKDVLRKELENPTDDFVRFILTDVYDGQKNQKVIDKFRTIVKKSFNSFISELMNFKITSALKTEEGSIEQTQNDSEPQVDPVRVITTDEEMQAFYIIRGILTGIVPIKDVVNRDTESYFGVLYKDNSRKPLCRLNLDTKKKQILIPDENKNFTRYYIETVDDIYNYKNNLIEVAKRYLE